MSSNFVLFSTQRSGSTWVIDMLNNHPAVTAYSELFLQDATGTPKWGGAKDQGFWNDYFLAQVSKEAGKTREEILDTYLDQIYAPRAGCQSVGFKLMYGQLGAYPELLDYFRLKGIAVVHLVRENLVDVLLSKEIAAKRGIYHSRSGESVNRIKVCLSAESFLAALIAQKQTVQRARRLLATSALRYFEVCYEALAMDPSRFAEILDFLGTSQTEFRLASTLVKLNVVPHKDSIENYESIALRLRGTEFEEMLR